VRTQRQKWFLDGSGSYDLAIVGESHYQQHLERLVGRRHPEGVQIECEAELYLEPNNPYDPNAVRVDIGGQAVGYLARELAPQMRALLGRSGLGPGARVGVRAVIVGGRTGQSYGVWLDVDTEEEEEEEEEKPPTKRKSKGKSGKSNALPAGAPPTLPPPAGGRPPTLPK
jgi:hypothetical protein